MDNTQEKKSLNFVRVQHPCHRNPGDAGIACIQFAILRHPDSLRVINTEFNLDKSEISHTAITLDKDQMLQLTEWLNHECNTNKK